MVAIAVALKKLSRSDNCIVRVNKKAKKRGNPKIKEVRQRRNGQTAHEGS